MSIIYTGLEVLKAIVRHFMYFFLFAISECSRTIYLFLHPYSHRTDSLLPFKPVLKIFKTLKHSRILIRKKYTKCLIIAFNTSRPVHIKYIILQFYKGVRIG